MIKISGAMIEAGLVAFGDTEIVGSRFTARAIERLYLAMKALDPALIEVQSPTLFQEARITILNRLEREGYIVEPTYKTYSDPSMSDSLMPSPQWRIRQGEAPVSFRECTTAVLEALILQGGVTAWDGDGVGCVAQMVWAQHSRAEKAEAALAAMPVREDVERLREALEKIAEDFGDFPAEHHKHLGDTAWRSMAFEQSDIARAALRTRTNEERE